MNNIFLDPKTEKTYSIMQAQKEVYELQNHAYQTNTGNIINKQTTYIQELEIRLEQVGK